MSDRFIPNAAARVLVVGDVILDRYVHGAATRISPEAPVPVVRVGRIEERPGGAANVAVNIRSLGIHTQLAGIAGLDAAGDTLAQLLAEAGVRWRGVRVASSATITKQRVISQHQQLLRLDYESGAVPDVSALHAAFGELLKESDCVVFSDYAKGSLARIDRMIAAARARDIPLLVDPKAREFDRYAGATLLTPNLREFEQAVGSCSGEADIAAKGVELCRRLGLRALVVTRGESGMSLVDAERGTTRHLPARAQEVFDVTGAGDTVIAVLAAALASGYALELAAEYANVAAGMVVARLGTAAVTAEEINDAVAPRSRPAGGRGTVLSREALLDAVAAARRRGETIVMTNGCFDLLHAGHVACLAGARGLGDRLLVAVNDDASVLRLKGPGRPLRAVEDRMRVLAALASVDWVTPFSEDTPQSVIEQVRPDVLVKGGDYRPEQVAGAETVRAYGGRVVIVPLVEGQSTSAVIRAIRSR